MDEHVAHMRLGLATAPRCRATSKRSGRKCEGFCVKGFPVCRMHGARSNPPTGERHGRYRHGRYTKEATAGRKQIAALIREVQEGMAMICEAL